MKPAVAGILIFGVFLFGNSDFPGAMGQLCPIGGNAFVNSFFAPIICW